MKPLQTNYLQTLKKTNERREHKYEDLKRLPT